MRIPPVFGFISKTNVCSDTPALIGVIRVPVEVDTVASYILMFVALEEATTILPRIVVPCTFIDIGEVEEAFDDVIVLYIYPFPILILPSTTLGLFSTYDPAMTRASINTSDKFMLNFVNFMLFKLFYNVSTQLSPELLRVRG